MSSCVWTCVVSLRFDFFLSLECLYNFSHFFISSILVIIFHVVATAEHKNPCAHADWGVLPRGDTQPSHRLWAQPARQLRLLRNLCSDLPEWIRRHRHQTVVLVRCGTRRWACRKSAFFTLFIQEREEPANLRQLYHSHEESFLPAQSFSVCHSRTVRPVYEPSSDLSQKRKSSRDLENERIRILFERQKEQNLADFRAEIQKHKFQADSDRRSIQELTRIIDSHRMELDHTITGCDQSRRDQLPLRELSEQNRAPRETRIRNMRDMEELRKIHVPKVEELSRRKLTGDQNTIMELRAQIQQLQNEVNCMNDSRDFLDQWTIPRSQSTSVTSTLSWSMRIAEPQQSAARYLEFAGISGNVFANARASSSKPYPGGFNSWISNVAEDTPVLTSTWRTRYMWWTPGERQTPDTTLDPRCQSGPSAGNSFDPKEGRFSKNYGADWQRLQISDLHFDKFPNPAKFFCWKIRFKTEVCTCSQFPTEAMLWIKEVEMVESVDDLKSSRSIRGIQTPDFELLDARIASALNKIIQNTRFKKKVSLEETQAHKEDRFLRGRQIACLIYAYFRVTGTNDSVENYADLFTVVLWNDDFQECDIKWDEILLSMTQIPSDDILQGLYTLRIRESEKLKTVLELYNMEIH